MVEFWRFKSVDLADYNLLQGEFHYSLVLLSILVSSLAAYSCLIVIERMWSSNEAKTVSLWRLFGSIVFGLVSGQCISQACWRLWCLRKCLTIPV